MHLVRRKGQVVYEDLLRELELVEQQLMTDNSALAMTVMVLEAKLRDRFQQMDLQNRTETMDDEFLIRDEMSVAELEALIPRDLPAFPLSPIARAEAKKKTLRTIGLAAILAMATACGVFGLATALQVILTWFA
jgi:hypothetical protein